MAEPELNVAYVVTRGDDLGGAQVHVRDMTRAMRARGHRATIICGPRGIFTEQLEERSLPFRSLPHLVRPIDPVQDGRGLLELGATIRELEPNLIALHSSKTRMLGCLVARRAGIAALSTVHGWPFADGVPELRRRFYAFYERQAARLATAVATVSRYDQELALRHGIRPRRGITVVPNGMPDDAPQRNHGQASGPPRLLMIGRHSPQKDHPTLFQALAQLLDRPWSLDLVGTGPDQARHEALAAEHGLAGRLRFLGYRKDVPELMAAADLYVLCSHWEGLPRSIIEAMRAGLATVSSDVGGCRELVTDGETGYLAPRGDALTFARHLAALIDDPGQRRRLGAGARKRYQQEFTFETMFGRTLALYRATLEPG